MIGWIIKVIVICGLILVPDFKGKAYVSEPLCASAVRNPELTLENVYRELLYKQVKHPDIVLRQVIWETQWLKCDNCSKKFNNLFGFTTKRGFMKFKSWLDCIDYYKWWQEKLSVEEDINYYDFLKKANFAMVENYNQRLKSLDISSITEKAETSILD